MVINGRSYILDISGRSYILDITGRSFILDISGSSYILNISARSLQWCQVTVSCSPSLEQATSPQCTPASVRGWGVQLPSIS